MQKKIIVPVDFSAIAHNAYLYARELAKVYGTKLELVHVVEDKNLEDQQAEHIARIESQLSEFAQRFPIEETDILIKVKLQFKVIFGDLIPNIIKLSKAKDSYLIVMGSKPDHSVIEQVFGTNSSSVATQAHCPVLLIPKGIQYNAYRNILYASSLDSVDSRMVQQIKDFAHIFLAAIHFIHVKGDEKEKEVEDIEDRIYNQLFDKADPAFSFNMASIAATNVSKALNQYADENKIDLIVLVNRTHNLFKFINNKSTTHEMALNLQNPLMVYHLPKNITDPV